MAFEPGVQGCSQFMLLFPGWPQLVVKVLCWFCHLHVFSFQEGHLHTEPPGRARCGSPALPYRSDFALAVLTLLFAVFDCPPVPMGSPFRSDTAK